MIKKTNGRYRYVLLATVSAAALLVSVERGPMAQDAMADGAHWWLSVEGQFMMYGGDGSEISTIFPLGGSDPTLKPDDGWSGAVEFGIQQDGSPLSVVTRVRYGRSQPDNYFAITSTYSAFGGTNTAELEESHLIADIEFGRDVGLGSLGGGQSNVRVHGGLRFVKLESEAVNFYTAISSVVETGDRSFTGIGPRVGLDVTVPVTGYVRADFSVAAAAIFGTRKGEFSISPNFSDDVVVPNVEASAALTYLFNDRASVSAGYRYDHYWNAVETNWSTSVPNGGDRSIHGPYIGLTIVGSGPN